MCLMFPATSEPSPEAVNHEKESFHKAKYAIEKAAAEIEILKQKFPGKSLLVIGNKTDRLTKAEYPTLKPRLATIGIPGENVLLLSAMEKQGIAKLKNQLLSYINTSALQRNETIVTNSRHYHVLRNVLGEVTRIQEGLAAGLPGDLLAIDIRQALHYLGEITGQVTTEDLLGNIFANFCIGK